MTTVPITQIKSPEVRDRQDLGNIDELAQSIAAVGLLHPVVVTADYVLIAGDRRLAAVKQLGWAEVPVTVVDITTAADALRAEADENTCRKGLTPFEASLARQRRATILAEDAARRKRATQAQPGRGQTGGVSKLDTPSPNVERQRRSTRKLGAVGTGYSGSTLDKVDRVREAAEKGTVTKHGKTTQLPAPVVDIARRGVESLQDGTARPDKALADVEQAISEHLAEDPEIAALTVRANFHKAVVRAADVTRFDPEALAAVADPEVIDSVTRYATRVADWAAKFQAARPARLTALQGGRK